MLTLLIWIMILIILPLIVLPMLFKSASRSGPAILWRTKKGLKLLTRLARKWEGMWNALADFGVILAFGFLGGWYIFRRHAPLKRLLLSLVSSIFLLAFSPTFDVATLSLLVGGGALFGCSVLISSAFNVLTSYFTHQPVLAAVAPVIPGLHLERSPLYIPWYGWISILLLLIVHEGSHGVLARINKFRITSAGVLSIGAIPLGAFVEPDEEQMARDKMHKRMRVFAVGSAANFVFGFAVLGLLLIASPLATPLFSSMTGHPAIVKVLPNGSAYGALQDGMKVISINGTDIMSKEGVLARFKELGPNQIAEVVTDNGTFTLRLNDEAMAGVYLEDTIRTDLPLHISVMMDILGFLFVTQLINIGVALMNILPIYPFDGGRMMEDVLRYYNYKKKRARRVVATATCIMALVILINVLPLFIPAA